MKRRSLRFRLTVLYGWLFLVAGAAMLAVTYLLVQQSLDARIGAFFPRPPDRPPGVTVTERVPDHITDTITQVRQGQEKFRAATLNSMLTRGGIALVGVGLIAGAFGWLVAGRVLQPLQEITATARRISRASGTASGLHERIALDSPPDEVKELADTFDSMLERLDRSFDGQRRFVANASHEMRTPLALNRALVELAVTRPGAPPEVIALGEQLLAVNLRHERLIDGLLMLADSENAIVDQSTVDLAEIVPHVLSTVDTTNLTVASTLDSAAAYGDPVLLERMTHNLVENAIRHNVATEPKVDLSTSTVDGMAVLVVSNTGPVVPGYEIETLFQPFRRMDGDRLGRERGFGLGLSIVRAIVRAHGGQVEAVPRDGGGLTVTVHLPLAT